MALLIETRAPLRSRPGFEIDNKVIERTPRMASG
jgi:hypothetical protein